MSLTIKTNLSSLIAQNSLKTSTNKLNQAIERMSSGAKINHAKDNAANYSIATNMTTKINALQVAEDNCAMGLDLISTASSSLEQMSDLTSRLRSLATQAQNGTYGDKSIEAINTEAQAIIQEMSRIKDTTNYNGIKLLSNENKRDTSSMTTLASVDETVKLTSGSYSISTAEELAKLATMTNNGLVGENTEFVLANDIDLSAYSTGEGWTPIGNSKKYGTNFSATFDGNNYTIYNLYINKPESGEVGLFGFASNATLCNIHLKDINITGSIKDNKFSGGLIGSISDSVIFNCSASGKATAYGGLIGKANGVTINNCSSGVDVNGGSSFAGLLRYDTRVYDSFATGDVAGSNKLAGFVTDADNAYFTNCYATGNVTSDLYAGGFMCSGNNTVITNCYAMGEVKGQKDRTGGFAAFGGESFENTYYTDTTGQTIGVRGDALSGNAELVTISQLNSLIDRGILPDYRSKNNTNFEFQIGINSSGSSQVSVEISPFDISALNNFDIIAENAFSKIDKILSKINEQQTTLGAAQNRLESALDEISTQYENLVSSRSTIMDADMAEVSSEYIRQQILQEASATLMATANQSPAIALQLI